MSDVHATFSTTGPADAATRRIVAGRGIARIIATRPATFAPFAMSDNIKTGSRRGFVRKV